MNCSQTTVLTASYQNLIETEPNLQSLPSPKRTELFTIYLESISKLTHKLFNHCHCHI